MTISKVETAKTAELAKLSFSASELTAMTVELKTILSYMNKLDELDTDTVSAKSIPDTPTVLRDDTPMRSLTPNQVFLNSENMAQFHFIVPKVIDLKNESE